jgi:ribosomal protein L23
VAFPTGIPQVQIKNFLGAVYGLNIKVVHTVNHEGKKKFNKQTRRWYRKPDWKKAWVYLNDPINVGFAASAATTPKPN